MTDSVVTLDDFEFDAFEAPEQLPFGGAQRLSAKTLIGGVRVADAMGPEDRLIGWSGRFVGEDAIDRARMLDAKRKAGRDLALTWGDLAYTVKIAEFLPEVEKATDVPFSISLMVITDDADPLPGGDSATADEVVGSDLDAADVMGGRIADGPLTGLLGNVRSAVSAAGSLAGAARAALGSISAGIASAQARVTNLIGTAEATISSVTHLGGVGDFLTAAKAGASLTAQMGAMTRCADLYDLGNVLGRVSRNIDAIGASGARVVTAGGDLMHLASSAYGDAREWTTIAKANGLTDPTLAGLQTLIVPPKSSGSGGVLGG